MGKRGWKGAMSVFFSVVTVVLLSLVCSLAESARMQGARVKAAAVMDMALFSVFGEYEAELLKQYDVFGVDAGAGRSGGIAENLGERLEEYIDGNTREGLLSIISGRSLFPVTAYQSEVTEYLLLTDGNGSVFRDQVVQNFKSAFGTELLSDYLKLKEQGEELIEAGEDYSIKEAQAKEQLLQAEAAEIERQKETSREGETETAQNVVTKAETVENPLGLIERLKRSGILALVMERPESVSQKSVEKGTLPADRRLNEGGLKWERSEDGILEDGIFQWYLFDHFACFQDKKTDGALDYELEYLLAGKCSDAENLKAVVHRLLLMREGANLIYVLANAGMRQSAEALAAAIAGGVPGVTLALTAALLLAWAYGESLLDVRILLSGGKVPVIKTAESFRLTLENLGKLTEVLKECDTVEGEGLSYRGYLQMLFLTGAKSAYPLRALGMIETTLNRQEGMEQFRVDHCAAGMKAEVTWKLQTVFSKVPAVFLGKDLKSVGYRTNGQFIYRE